jgi:hypothetical protein
MTEKEIIIFLKDFVEPIEDNIFGKGFRASVTLKDGTFLPCVIFRDSEKIVNLAIRRFNEEQSRKSIFTKKSNNLGYRKILKTFVAKGNRINSYDIANVEKSRFAIPVELINQIKGETAMSWTAFVIEFNNGEKLSFGTSWSFQFFDLPIGFDFANFSNVISGVYLTKENKIKHHKSVLSLIDEKENLKFIYREKPFFECFLEEFN